MTGGLHDAVTYEVREQVTFALLPTHDYGVSGQCITDTGTERASIYAQGGSGRGTAMGIGLGGRIGLTHVLTPPEERTPTWWGLRVGAGLDLGLLYGNVDTGIPDATGSLCARLKNDGVAVGYQGSTVFVGQLSVLFGAQMGLGSESDDGAWKGVVLGAAWAPAVTWFKPWVAEGDVAGSLLGTELTVDFATIAKGEQRESGKRLSLFVMLPTQDHGPVVVTGSFGVVWY
jgi:hypothetical protein